MACFRTLLILVKLRSAPIPGVQGVITLSGALFRVDSTALQSQGFDASIGKLMGCLMLSRNTMTSSFMFTFGLRVICLCA
jgi:hypothetical protein